MVSTPDSSPASASRSASTPSEGAAPAAIDRFTLPLESVRGLSGLTSTADGRLLAVEEGAGHAVIFTPNFDDDDLPREAPRVLPVEGVPEGLDIEAITWLGGDLFAAGTESMDTSRGGDSLLTLQLHEDHLQVVESVSLQYSLMAATAEENHGIEGICAGASTFGAEPEANASIVALLENVIEVDGERFAHATIVDRASAMGVGDFIPALFALTSEDGKISGLSCTIRDGRIEVFAIERHYETMRVLRYELADPAISPPPRGEVLRVQPTVVVDLSGQVDGSPNPEGLELRGRNLWIMIDNHYGEQTGPNEVLRISLPGGASAL